MSERIRDGSLSMGVNELDEQILRGIPKGSTIALLADPKSMANQFLLHLAMTGRQTHYVTITRPVSSIEKEAELANRDQPIENMDIYPEYREENNMKANLERFVNRVGNEENFIVDNFSQVGDDLDSKEYQTLFRNIYKHTQREDAITFLLLLAEDESDLRPHERDMLNNADGVFQLQTRIAGGARDNLLYIYKLRGVREIHDRGIQVLFGDRITIDASREL